MPAINTNIQALVANQSLTVNQRGLDKAMQQLSTGKRINGAADDAAGVAISDKMTAQVRGLNMAVRNANDGISMIQTVDGAAEGATSLLQRMRELAVQAANGTNSSSDVTAINSEWTDLSNEITRISNNTTWNGFNVTDGTTTAVAFQVGANSSQVITVTFKDVDGITAVASALALTAASATAISAVDSAIAAIDSFRADLGAKINRLNYAADNLSNNATNQSASRSRILDTDYAKATTDLARSQIIQQAGTAMLAQANQSPYGVLALLK